VDDVANRLVALYDDLGMKRSVIRMKGWGAEVALSDRVSAAEDQASGEKTFVDFSRAFIQTANSMPQGTTPTRRSCNAPSLDEAAWAHYDQSKKNTIQHDHGIPRRGTLRRK
jgi:regulator of nonsense transcripts 1